MRRTFGRIAITLQAAPPMEISLAVLLFALVFIGGATGIDAEVRAALGHLVGELNGAVVAMLQ